MLFSFQVPIQILDLFRSILSTSKTRLPMIFSTESIQENWIKLIHAFTKCHQKAQSAATGVPWAVNECSQKFHLNSNCWWTRIQETDWKVQRSLAKLPDSATCACLSHALLETFSTVIPVSIHQNKCQMCFKHIILKLCTMWGCRSWCRTWASLAALSAAASASLPLPITSRLNISPNLLL